MRNAISSACLVLLICLGGSAWAKPKLAILGLEVAPGPTGAVDPAMTQIAKDITKELRQRAQSSASPYVIAPNSSKELTDEKLLMSCDNEAKECMAVIGAGLSADMLLYGRVERKGEVYRVSLKLLDIKAKTIEIGADEMPVGGVVTGVSRRLFAKLIGDGPDGGGTLVVTARSQNGVQIDGSRVLVDEDKKGVLTGGKLTITGLSEGRHVVAIEARGLSRFEATVTVRGGEQSTLDAQLTERDAQVPPTSRSHATLWKVSLGTSLGIAALGGGLAALGYFEQQRNIDKVHVMPDPSTAPKGPTISADDCGDTSDAALADIKRQRMITFDSASADKFRSACKWHTAQIAGFVAVGVGGVAALASLIMLVRDPGPEEQSPTVARGKKAEVAVAPIVSPQVAGATLLVRW
ncbi:MAG TPA: hypothetical protein VFT22_10635 [Kofleriaceae bacterium]|nr:hypothetical protein [Kofleriaceae bacterium]